METVFPGLNLLTTVVIAFFGFLVWKAYVNIEWFTGSMETHTDITLRIAAKQGVHAEPIRLLWWDPTLGETPSKKEHGKEADLSTVYIFLPPERRQKKATRWEKIKKLFAFPERW